MSNGLFVDKTCTNRSSKFYSIKSKFVMWRQLEQEYSVIEWENPKQSGFPPRWKLGEGWSLIKERNWPSTTENHSSEWEINQQAKNGASYWKQNQPITTEAQASDWSFCVAPRAPRVDDDWLGVTRPKILSGSSQPLCYLILSKPCVFTWSFKIIWSIGHNRMSGLTVTQQHIQSATIIRVSRNEMVPVFDALCTGTISVCWRPCC